MPVHFARLPLMPTRRAPMTRLDPASDVPMYQQLYLALRDHMMTGQLRKGERLASTRTLARQLDVSRFTVVSALERLLAEGYMTARRGSGTFVVDTLPEQLMRPAARPSAPQTGPVRVRQPVLSARGRQLSAAIITGPRTESDEPRPFRPRRPALDIFPAKLWASLLRRQWRGSHHRLLDYGDPAGYRPLREAIADHIAFSRGLRCTADQIIVTSGGQQAFDILFRLLLDPGDRAWIEEPGYLDVRAALIGAGARLVPVRVDAQGIVVAEGVRAGAHARLAVVSPSHQYPTGTTMSATRRAALLDWARRSGAWVIEDDYDSHFRYRGRPFLALHRTDYDATLQTGGSERVIYVGTFSKTMFPALRLGFCVVPEALVEPVANARAVAGRNSATVDQAALAEFITAGHYDRHLRRSRVAYRERYEAMQFHFKRELEGVVSLVAASAGTHVIGRLIACGRGSQRRRLAVRIAKAAAEAGLVVFPLSRYCLEPPGEDSLVLGYGGLTPRRIAAGAARLARVIEGTR